MPMLNLRHQLRNEQKNKRSGAAGPKTQGCFLPKIAQAEVVAVTPQSLKKSKSSTDCGLPDLCQQHVLRPPTRGKSHKSRTLSQKIHLPEIIHQKHLDVKSAVKYSNKSDKGIKLPPIDTTSGKEDCPKTKTNFSSLKNKNFKTDNAEEIESTNDKLDMYVPRPPTRGKPVNARSNKYLNKVSTEKAPKATNSVQILDLSSTYSPENFAKQLSKFKSTDNSHSECALGDVKTNTGVESKSSKGDFLTMGMVNVEPVLGKPPINPDHKPNQHAATRRMRRRRGTSQNGEERRAENRSQNTEAEQKRLDELVSVFDSLVQAALDAKEEA